MEDTQASNNFKVLSSRGHYDVIFKSSKVALKELSENTDKNIYVIDSNVFYMYNELFEEIENNQILIIESNEDAKKFDTLSNYIDILLKKNITRDHKLIAIGGGIIQDIVCFVSQILFRGLNWIFIPTTLLAQGDSCIGSKSSINYKSYKNLIGSFYPPSKIIIDTLFLNSLSKSELYSGIGEMLHYFPLHSEKSFYYFDKYLRNFLSNKIELNDLILKSLNIKKSIIEIDEQDKGERIKFNYGHSFGHAIESTTNFRIPHGIAVSMGIHIANDISVGYHKLDKKVADKINNTAKLIYSEFLNVNIDIDKIIEALKKDKKNKNTKLGVILLDDFGKASLNFITPDNEFKILLSNSLKSL